MSPAIAQAVSLGRVQSLHSDIEDLRLRDGRRFTFLLGGSVTSAQITRTIDGSSSLQITVYDPELKTLQLPLISERFDVNLDGLWFRFLSASKSGKNITLTFEDRDVARLRELRGPKKAYRSESTRARFIVDLVRELRPKVPVYCPEIDVVQPIENRRQGKQAAEAATANRDKGIGDTKGLTVKGVKATAAQIAVGERALRTAASHNAPFRVQVALIETLAVESVFGSASSNYMEMIPSVVAASKYSPTVVEEACAGFLLGYVPGHTGAIAFFRQNPSAPAHQIAQGVQRSGAGAASNGAANYGEWEAEAREWVEAFSGLDGLGEGAFGSESAPEPYSFEVGPKETYWGAIQRLASEVNWRAFFVAGRFFFIDEVDLLRGQVRLAIDRDTPGVEDVDFDYNANKRHTEITVIAYAGQWKVPPGAVVTVAEYGPISLGFGDAPLTDAEAARIKAGKAVRLSQNRKAGTKEGRGRYIVSSIECPLGVGGEARRISVTLKRATRPLPEPAPNTTAGTVAGGNGAGPVGIGDGAEAMVNWARSVLGTAEGSALHQKWASSLGYGTDLPWCSIFVAFGLKTIVGFDDLPPNPAYSGDWLQWSGGDRVATSDVKPGDLVIYDWGDGGITDHVALAIGNGKRIGGNESNRVSESPLDIGRAVGVVRPKYP